LAAAGAFKSEDLDRDLLAGSEGEAKVHPHEGDTVPTADGGSLRWTRVSALDDFVKLDRAFGSSERVVAYAYSGSPAVVCSACR